MAKLHVIYDPTDRIECHIEPEHHARYGIKVAEMSVGDGLEGRDIYEVARRLAEMLLEQIDHNG